MELGYSKLILESRGHEARIIDAHLENLSLDVLRNRFYELKPDFTILTTAPSYLFWRCPPPELRVPMNTAWAVREFTGMLVVIGPHASTSPLATIEKCGADVAISGEPEQVLPALSQKDFQDHPSLASRKKKFKPVRPFVCDLKDLPSLEWKSELISRHSHHHHRFDSEPSGFGAEVEYSRGCPYRCSFCAKKNYRNSFRKRPAEKVLSEIDRLVLQGVKYFYFIDELFTPDSDFLLDLMRRNIKFGIQTRIDIWNEKTLDLLGRAGCVSIEAGIESISPEGRFVLNKKCGLSNEEITGLLIYAKKQVPFVQANLLQAGVDRPEEIESWRLFLRENGIWANKPVPVFPYPGSPEYFSRWGEPDDRAWERAHSFYVETYHEFSDIQEYAPKPIEELEARKMEWKENCPGVSL